MKIRNIWIGLVILLFSVSSALGYTYYLASDGTKVEAQFASSIYTADQAAVYTGRGLFKGMLITTDGTNNVTVSVYDNTANSGTKIIPTFVALGSSYTTAVSYDPGVAFATGISVDVTIAGGGTASYQVLYDK